MHYPSQSPDSDEDDESQNLGIVVRGSSAQRSTYHPVQTRPRPPSSNPNSTVVPGVRKNQYVCGNYLGHGKIGKVFQCRDVNVNTDDGFRLAMKIVPKYTLIDKTQLLRRNNPANKDLPLNNDMLTTVLKEAAILRKCSHPNIVPFIEVIDDPQDGNIYLVTENLEGGPIRWEDADNRPVLTLPQIRRIMRDVILGLEYLHHEGIIHRDIKPQNMIWTKDRELVKLIDFGIAHYIPAAKETPSSSRHGKGKQIEQSDGIDTSLFPESDLRKTIGTPAFLAPEVVWNDDTQPSASNARGRPPITKSVDVWSLGVTFYCLLFGHLPFNPPESEQGTKQRSEYLLYKAIGEEEWYPDSVMGIERVSTDEEWADDDDEEPPEGALVVQLLDGMLQKRPGNRISLADVKANGWILKDVPNPEEWLRVTSPSKDAIKPSSSWVKLASRKLMKLIPKKG